MSDTTHEGEAGTAGGPEEGEGVTLGGATVPDDGTGHWPSWRAKFLNDFRSAKNAKANDGLRAPTIPDPEWSESPGATTAVLFEAMRLRHNQALARIESAESRADRLVRVSVSLLALAFLALGYQAAQLRESGAPPVAWLVCMGFSGAAIACLGISVVQGVGVDRVGFVQPADPSLAAHLTAEDAQRRSLALQEYKAARVANWTARKKVNEFLQARAWLTRGLLALAASGACVIGVWTATAGSRGTSEDPSIATTTSIRATTSIAPTTTTTAMVPPTT